MKPTNKQLQMWIEEYIAKGYGEKVKNRAWKGQYIRGHAPWNNEEDCYHTWLNLINNREQELSAIKSFQKLYDDVKAMRFKGIGDLTIYDTATMIGCPNGVFPEAVYLHAGAAIGATAIGIEGNIVEKTVFVTRFPAFELLEPIQIEDFLCIYKKQLHGDVTDSPISCCGCC